MELKRILAKDLRRATEKAVKLYGDDVLVISNAKVNGQVEVIVAVDVGAQHDPEPWLEHRPAAPAAGGDLFQSALKESLREQKEMADDEDDDVTYETLLKKKPSADEVMHARDRRAAISSGHQHLRQSRRPIRRRHAYSRDRRRPAAASRLL